MNFLNWVDLCFIKLDILASARAQENNLYLVPYTKYRPVLRTDSICVFSLDVICVLQAGDANWRTPDSVHSGKAQDSAHGRSQSQVSFLVRL